jgi:hypothetical protein
MTTPTPTTQPATPAPAPDKVTAAELRELFAEIREEIADLGEQVTNLQTDLATIRDGLTLAATQPAATASETPGQNIAFVCDAISLDYVDGKPLFKARGGKFAKFGVRVWPEMLAVLKIDPKDLQPGLNTLPAPIELLASLTEAGQPRKVIAIKK